MVHSGSGQTTWPYIGQKHIELHEECKVRMEGLGIDVLKFKVPTNTPGGKENTYNATKHFPTTHTKSRMTSSFPIR